MCEKHSIDTIESDYAIAPGETLREQLKAIDMSVVDLATHTGLTYTEIEAVLNGQVAITSNVAESLEAVLQVPKHFWLSLDEQYRQRTQAISKRTSLVFQSIRVKPVAIELDEALNAVDNVSVASVGNLVPFIDSIRYNK